MARQKRKDCDRLARHVLMIAELLPYLQHEELMERPEVWKPLWAINDTLREAQGLVTSCKGRERSAMVRWLTDSNSSISEIQSRFRDIESKIIKEYLLVFPFLSHIDITRRINRIYLMLIQTDRMKVQSLPASSQSNPLQSQEVSEDVLLSHGGEGEEFTLAELMAVTKNLARHSMHGRVYKGWLPDRRVLAIKKFRNGHAKEFLTELNILSTLHHEHGRE
uniref:MCAfunc domain-containing protein n=1 Tax=Leersia perrieri TaxID=77586 RepID=A0A0D9XV45_9ORYZ